MRYNIWNYEKAFSLGRGWQKSLIFDGCGVKVLASQGILTYCTMRTLPYQLYADECALFVLTAPLNSDSLSKSFFNRQKAPRLGCLVCSLAAGALAAVAAGVSAAQAVAVAAAAEQNCQNDDPPDAAATEAITVTHNRYLRNSRSEHWAHSMVFRRLKKVQTAY